MAPNQKPVNRKRKHEETDTDGKTGPSRSLTKSPCAPRKHARPQVYGWVPLFSPAEQEQIQAKHHGWTPINVGQVKIHMPTPPNSESSSDVSGHQAEATVPAPSKKRKRIPDSESSVGISTDQTKITIPTTPKRRRVQEDSVKAPKSRSSSASTVTDKGAMADDEGSPTAGKGITAKVVPAKKGRTKRMIGKGVRARAIARSAPGGKE